MGCYGTKRRIESAVTGLLGSVVPAALCTFANFVVRITSGTEPPVVPVLHLVDGVSVAGSELIVPNGVYCYAAVQHPVVGAGQPRRRGGSEQGLGGEPYVEPCVAET